MISRDIGILGYGETRHVKRTERTLFSFFAEAGRKALASAGLEKSDIDGIAVSSFFLAPDNAVTLCEQFGLSVSWAWQFTAGSAGPVAGVIDALHAIDAGRANVVLCLAGDVYSVARHYRLMENFNHSLYNYAAPHGFGGPNGLFGIIQRKYMETYGLERAQLGRIAVRAEAVRGAQRERGVPRAVDARGVPGRPDHRGPDPALRLRAALRGGGRRGAGGARPDRRLEARARALGPRAPTTTCRRSLAP